MSKIITRRSLFVGGIASLLCAPAIVRAASIMPVKKMLEPNFDSRVWELTNIQHYVFKIAEQEWIHVRASLGNEVALAA